MFLKNKIYITKYIVVSKTINDYETDVVFMGSGAAGICSSDAALAKGKTVIVFEKAPVSGRELA